MLSGNPTSPVIAPSDPNLLTLVIGGKSFTGWAQLTFTQNVDTCADAFAMVAPFDPSRMDLVTALVPWSLCYLYIGPDLVLTGYLEKIDTHHDERSRRVTVEGRSKTGQLVDCIVPGAANHQFNGTLQQIAQALCQPFGITVGGQYDTDPMYPIIDTEETIFKFLDRCAQGKAVNGMVIPGITQAVAKISCDGLGRLTVLPPYPSGSPVATLIEGKGPYLGGDTSYDATKRFSQYQIFPEGKQTVALGLAADPAVKLYRPTGKATGDIFGQDPNTLAKYERGMAYIAASSFSTRATGWRTPKTPAEATPTGPVWLKNTLITLQAPSIRIAQEAQFMIAGATMTLNEEGKKTTLRLVPPGSYVGQLPAVEPWA
jgi:prophage tail gpP-like protein